MRLHIVLQGESTIAARTDEWSDVGMFRHVMLFERIRLREAFAAYGAFERSEKEANEDFSPVPKKEPLTFLQYAIAYASSIGSS